MFLQRASECKIHSNCTTIYCITDENILNEDDILIYEAGKIVWESHAHSDTHSECRANPDHPLEGGDSTTEMCESCKNILNLRNS